MGDNWELLAAQLNLSTSQICEASAEPGDTSSLSSLSKDTPLLQHMCNHNLSQPHQRPGKLSASLQPRQDLTSLLSSQLQGQ